MKWIYEYSYFIIKKYKLNINYKEGKEKERKASLLKVDMFFLYNFYGHNNN